MRYITGILALLLAGCAMTGREDRQLSIVEPLTAWAQITGYQIIVPECANAVPSRDASGATAVEVLERLLEGTGLKYRFINERTVAIRCAG